MRQMVRNKALAWVLLIVFAVTSVFSTGSVFAETADVNAVQQAEQISIQGEISDGETADIPSDVSVAEDITMVSEYLSDDEIIDTIRSAMTAREDSISVDFLLDIGLTEEDIDLLCQYYIYAAMDDTDMCTPAQGDYLAYQLGSIPYECAYVEYSEDYLACTLVVEPAYYTTAAQEAEVDEAIEAQLAALINDEMTGYEKILSIYEYVCSNVAYDYEGLNDESDVTKYTAYGALIENEAVCQGYSLLMYRMLEEAGFDTRIITGVDDAGEPHAWNIVYLDGMYYNLDATWDAGNEDYNWFLNGSQNFEGHYADEYYTSEDFTALYQIDEYDYNAYSGEEDPDYGYFYYGYCDEDGSWKECALEFDESNYGEIVLPYNFNINEPVEIYNSNSSAPVYSKTITAAGDTAAITVSEVEFSVDIVVADETVDFPESIRYICFESEYDIYGETIFFDAENNATVELPYSFSNSGGYVEIYHYEGEAYSMVAIVDQIENGSGIGFNLNEDGKAVTYNVTFTIAEPSNDTGCNFDISVNTEFDSYYKYYWTDREADENGNLYITVPYGTFSDETAIVTLYGYPDHYGATINDEYYYEEELTVSAGTKEITKQITVVAEDKTEQTWNIIITESADEDVYLTELLCAIYDEEGNSTDLNIDPEAVLESNEAGEVYEVAVPAFYYQDVANEIGGITLYGTANSFADTTGLGQVYYLENGELEVTVTVASTNPEYADNVKNYKMKFVQETGSSTELDLLAVEWCTRNWVKDEIQKGDKQFGFMPLNLTDAKTEEGATVYVPAAFFETISTYEIDASLYYHIDAVQYSYIESADLELAKRGFDYYSDWLYFDKTKDSATYTFDVTGADKNSTQQYKFNVVKTDAECTAHDFVDFGVYEEPTCEEIGYRVAFCSICGNAQWTPIPVAHDYSVLNHDEENHWYECECGDIDTESAAAHTVDQWTTTVEPQIGIPGSKTGECAVCKIEITEEIPALEIEPELISKIELADTSRTYEGKAIEPAVTVYGPEDEVLKEGTDYEVEYSNNVNAGEATVTVTGISAYEGTLTATFVIEPQTLDDERITVVASTSNNRYDGTAKEPALTVRFADDEKDIWYALEAGIDYDVVYSNNIEVGTGTAVLSGTGNFTGTKTAEFTIRPALISDAAVTVEDGTYTGSEVEPAVTVTLKNGTVLEEGTDYTVTYENNINAGTAAKVIITGIGRYEGTLNEYFNIETCMLESVNATVSLTKDAYTYDGTAKKPVVTVIRDGNIELIEDEDFTVAYKDNTAAGTATVTVTGKGNYSGTMTAEFTIEPADIADTTVTLAKTEYTYNGTAKEPAVTVKYGSATLKKDTDYTVAYKDNVKIGTATVTVTGIGNYAGTTAANFTIVEGSALFEDTDILRMYGKDRYDTTIAAADALKQNQGVDAFDTVIVACGTNFADALAGSYLAKVTEAPILVVDTNSNASMKKIRNYINKNLTAGGKIYILGGEGAVSASFENSLSKYDVARLGGKDRYVTNLNILKEADRITGIPASEVLVCTGTNFADSLSASAVGKPILLADNKLTSAQKSYLKSIAPDMFYLVGGPAVVSDTIKNGVAAYGDVERIYGANRYATSSAIAAKFFPGQRDTIVLAVGDNFPDGLSGGPVAMSLDAPLLLINEPYSAYKYAASYADKCGASQAAVLGGPTLISDKVVQKIIK